MDRASELAAALRRLAVDQDDTDLADALLEAVAKVEQHADYKLRNQTQGVIGETHSTLQDRIDSLFNVARDTHQLVFSVQQEQIQQGAAVGELRATFHTELSAFGERITDIEGRVGATEAGLKESRQDRADLRQQNEEAKQERARIEQKVDAFAKDFYSLRDEIRILMASARKPEEVERLVGLIERHEQELAAKRAESGDADR